MGLELRPQDRRNRIWAPIEKKIKNLPPTQYELVHPASLKCALPESDKLSEFCESKNVLSLVPQGWVKFIFVENHYSNWKNCEPLPPRREAKTQSQEVIFL